MNTHTIFGVAMIVMGVAEPVVGLLIASRMKDPSKKPLIIGATIVSGITFLGVGVAFLTGAFGGSTP